MSEILSAKEIWKTVKGSLQIDFIISRANYRTWIEPTEGISFDGRLFIVGVHNVFVQEWLEKRLKLLVKKTLIETLTKIRETLVNPNFRSEDIQIQFQVIDRDTPNAAKAQSTDLFVATSKPTLNPDYTFETFVAGKGNELALNAALDVAKNPGRRWNPLFLISPSGMGKTHLLHAIAHYMSTNKGLPVILKTATQFTNEYVAAAIDGKMRSFMDRFLGLTGPVVFLVDDIQSFGEGNKKKTVTIFSQCFCELYGRGFQVVFAGDNIDNMSGLPKRLASRIYGGLIVEIKPSGPETSLAILKAKVSQQLSQQYEDLDPILALIVEKTADANGDVRVLLGKWNALLNNFKPLGKELKELSLEVAKEILDGINFTLAPGSPDSLAENRVIKAVTSHFGVTLADLKSRERSKKITKPRQMAMYLLREKGCSLKRIGEILGDRHHSTVLHGCRMISEDPSLRETARTIQRSCK